MSYDLFVVVCVAVFMDRLAIFERASTWAWTPAGALCALLVLQWLGLRFGSVVLCFVSAYLCFFAFKLVRGARPPQ